MIHEIRHGDGIAGLESLEKSTAHLVVTDPPWGATRAKWDKRLHWGRWWAAIDHALAPGRVCVV